MIRGLLFCVFSGVSFFFLFSFLFASRKLRWSGFDGDMALIKKPHELGGI